MIHLITSQSKILNLRFTNVCMFLADPLFQIVDSLQKISPDFQTIIYNLQLRFQKTLNCSHAYDRDILMICFFIWERGEDSLKQFIKIFNTFHITMNFTAEQSKEEINFLNVDVRLRNRQLETDLHIKKTDTHQFLDSTSCHPYHCKKSMLYSQALRLTGFVLIMKCLIDAATTQRNG